VIGLVAILLIGVIFGNSNSFHHCVQAIKHYPSYNASDEKIPTFGRLFRHFRIIGQCEAVAIDRHNGIVAAFAGLIVACFTYTLWRSTEKLWAASERQIDAVLASLDRPWLVIERLRHNQTTWARCQAPLVGQFVITNYGKAPAILISVKASYFKSPGPSRDKDFAVQPLPGELRSFPPKDGLGFAISKHLAEPSTSMSQHISYTCEEQPVIAEGESTPLLYFRGHRQLEPLPNGIPIEVTAHGYLMGFILYSIPGQGAEVINFCYEERREGGFRVFNGAPYNERTKAPYA
jgi:hypothetical protein